MREKVRAFMEQYHMVTAGERVLLGLSGGADSVCLFHLLRELQEPLGFSLLAVHVNHNLRGAEAGRDAAFAENLCREYRKRKASLDGGGGTRGAAGSFCSVRKGAEGSENCARPSPG